MSDSNKSSSKTNEMSWFTHGIRYDDTINCNPANLGAPIGDTNKLIFSPLVTIWAKNKFKLIFLLNV